MRNNYSKFLSAILGAKSVVLSNNNAAVDLVLEKAMESLNDMQVFRAPRRENEDNKICPDQVVDLMADMGIDKHF